MTRENSVHFAQSGGSDVGDLLSYIMTSNSTGEVTNTPYFSTDFTSDQGFFRAHVMDELWELQVNMLE